MAMHQVAQYWNECMQIAEEERDAATWELDALQDDLNRHKAKLIETESKLEEKKRALQQFEERYRQLEHDGSKAADQNKKMTDETALLRDRLAESQSRAVQLENKCQKYKTKINEAIIEQQDLWKRSRAFHAESMKELEREHQQRISEAAKVEQALDASRLKSEQLRKSLGDIREKMERENESSELHALDSILLLWR